MGRTRRLKPLSMGGIVYSIWAVETLVCRRRNSWGLLQCSVCTFCWWGCMCGDVCLFNLSMNCTSCNC